MQMRGRLVTGFQPHDINDLLGMDANDGSDPLRIVWERFAKID